MPDVTAGYFHKSYGHVGTMKMAPKKIFMNYKKMKLPHNPI